MKMEDIIIHLFCSIDDALASVKRHKQAILHPSEVVTIGVLYALKGNGYRAFYRWLSVNWRDFFPKIPEISRLLRNLATYHHYTRYFLQDPTFFTIIDSFGIELLHPIREGRQWYAVGRKGRSNHRWIVGIKDTILLNQHSEIVAWDWAPANRHDQTFRSVATAYDGQTLTLADQGFAQRGISSSNIKVCARGTWNERMRIETLFRLLTTLFHAKNMRQRAPQHIQARLSYMSALVNILLSLSDGKLSFTQFTL